MTKLSMALALCLGLSACLTEVDDEDTVLTGDDLETVTTDLGADLVHDLTGEPTDPNVLPGDEDTNTCGGQPRLKGDGPCLPR